MNDVERATALIRKAMSTDSEAEARTCAFLAVKIIVKKKLKLTAPGDTPFLRPHYQHRTRREQNRRPADAPSRTSYESECIFCEKRLHPGDKVFWSKIFKVMVCPECFEKEILEKQRMDDLGTKGKQRHANR